MKAIWRAIATIQERKVVEAGHCPEIFRNPLDEWQQFSDLNKVSLTDPLSTNYHPLTEECKTIRFSNKDSIGLFKITDERLITRISDSVFEKGSLVLRPKPIFPFRIYQFSFIVDANPSQIGFGLCSHETVKKHGYTIADNENHGCYIAFRNKEMIVNGSRGRFKAQSSIPDPLSTSFSGFYWDCNEGKLHFLDEDLHRVQSLDISPEQNLTDFYPCVFMSTKEIAVLSRLGGNFAGNGRHQFSSFYKAPHIRTSYTHAFHFQHAVGLLDWPIASGKSYRFLIEQRNSDNMAFSLYYYLIYDTEKDNWSPTKHSRGMVAANGQEHQLTPINYLCQTNNKVEFTTGDTVELIYHYNANRFIFRNLTTGKAIERRLGLSMSTERRALFLGVILDKEGDSVRCISD
jgi:hypothetical protein